MPSALDLVVRSYKALGVVGGVSSAVSPTTEERNDGLTALNAMLDSWSNESLSCYQIQEQSFTLTIGTSQYSIGSGGTINATRPLAIRQAYVQDSSGNNYLMAILPRDRWNMIGNRSSTITSQIPTDLFYDPVFPLGLINVFPTPLAAYTVYFDSLLQLSTLSTLTTNLALPVGYERAIVYNLAVEISNMFGVPMPPNQPGAFNIGELASISLANIKRTNAPEIIANYDGAIVSHSYATYNIFRDA